MLNITYQTSRLSVVEVFNSDADKGLLVDIMKLLTPKVVENLPPYFTNIRSVSAAQIWFEKMLIESRLFVVKDIGKNTAIGFVFVSVENDSDAYIGYLLGESYWGNGYATELLKGLIAFINHENKLKRLIAGVDANNLVSSKLLNKLGFINCSSENNHTIFYEYQLSKT